MNKKMEQKMIKIRNITKKWFKNEEDIFCCEKAMKEYAEFYAKKCLEIASNNLDYWQSDIIQITKDSVKYLDLPEHE